MIDLGELLGAERVMRAVADRVAGDHRRHFHGVYLRTMIAVREALQRNRFEDPGWVVRWDRDFIERYLAAVRADLAGRPVAGAWAAAFGAEPGLPVLRHVLLGMNAHISFDLPQSVVASVPPAGFDDAPTMRCRERDHRRIDAVLAGRIVAEGAALTADIVPARADRLLGRVSVLATRSFLVESRHRVWANAIVLDSARRAGTYDQTVADLDVLVTANALRLVRPGRVLLRLGASGFGVSLPS